MEITPIFCSDTTGKKEIIDTLRTNFSNGSSYETLLGQVKENMRELATHRNYFSELASHFFHVKLPASIQEAIVILAMKRESLADGCDVTPEHIKGVIQDLLLNKEDTKADAEGKRHYYTSNRLKDNHKHQIIATIEYSNYRNLTSHVSAGIDRLKKDPLPLSLSLQPIVSSEVNPEIQTSSQEALVGPTIVSSEVNPEIQTSSQEALVEPTIVSSEVNPEMQTSSQEALGLLLFLLKLTQKYKRHIKIHLR